ncbi:acetyltransferase [Cryomyces antarcticus]|uniref:Acetyltransferase n=1 Tax=Cryomyces antarcticus TaxID=329879 RepID=A0ABR0M7M9_9PEZI|nr:Peroxygenase 1 [Cryomyces antarcticus]KAK5291081.1 acetyltransferase [Cryomyces antarcticus]
MVTAPERPTVRLATREDVPTILFLIKELAAYENASSSVKATEATLALTLSLAPSPHHHHHASHSHSSSKKHAHNDKPPPDEPLSSSGSVHAPPTQTAGYAKTLLLRTPGNEGAEVAGMALYFHNYSTWRAQPGIYLEDLFVLPQYRKRGYGTLLIRELAKEVVRIDGGRLEWSCLKWNEPSLKFYEKLGATQMEEWVGLRVDGDALKRLAKGEVDVEEAAEEAKKVEKSGKD